MTTSDCARTLRDTQRVEVDRKLRPPPRPRSQERCHAPSRAAQRPNARTSISSTTASVRKEVRKPSRPDQLGPSHKADPIALDPAQTSFVSATPNHASLQSAAPPRRTRMGTMAASSGPAPASTSSGKSDRFPIQRKARSFSLAPRSRLIRSDSSYPAQRVLSLERPAQGHQASRRRRRSFCTRRASRTLRWRARGVGLARSYVESTQKICVRKSGSGP